VELIIGLHLYPAVTRSAVSRNPGQISYVERIQSGHKNVVRVIIKSIKGEGKALQKSGSGPHEAG
jgi:hypothetical protein